MVGRRKAGIELFVIACLSPANISAFPRRLEDVFSIIILCLPRRLQDVFAIRLPQTPSRRLQDVFKTSSQDVFKTSSRRLQDLLPRCLLQVFLKRSSRHLHEDVLQLRLEDVRLERQKKVILKTSSVRLHQDECLVGEPVRSISCSLQCNSSKQAFPELFQLMLESTQGNILRT